MGKLDGKVAIVTGAARGLGRAYAKRLAELGAKIAVADLNLHSYEEFEAEAKDMTADSTVAEIAASGGTAFGIEVDVRDHEAVKAVVAQVVQEWGRVDVLVANAGRRSWPTDGYQGQHPRSGAVAACHRDEPVRNRLHGQRGCPDHEAAAFREDHHGEPQSPAPRHARDGGYAHYGAAKAAIAHYTRYLAQDLGVAIGMVRFPLTKAIECPELVGQMIFIPEATAATANG